MVTENSKVQEREEASYESTGIGQENLRQVQDHPPFGCRSGDLRHSQAQAASGLVSRAAQLRNKEQDED